MYILFTLNTKGAIQAQVEQVCQLDFVHSFSFLNVGL